MTNYFILIKSIQGETQKCNEALNNIIWSRCPKNTFVTRFLLEVGVSSAILYFNYGTYGLNRVFEFLDKNFDFKISLAFHLKISNIKKNLFFTFGTIILSMFFICEAFKEHA